MEVKQAVKTAKEFIIDLFGDETITGVGLEEVDLDIESNDWKITIGFYRPLSHRGTLTTVFGKQHEARSYKVVSINKQNGRVSSVTDRVLPAVTE